MSKYYKYTIADSFGKKFTEYGTGHDDVYEGNRRDVIIYNENEEVSRIRSVVSCEPVEETPPPLPFFINGERISGEGDNSNP